MILSVYFFLGAVFQLVNTVNGPFFPPETVSITEGNVNTTLPVCAQLVEGGQPGGQSSISSLQRDAVLHITTIEGAAGK